MTTTSLKMSLLALIIFLTTASAGELTHEFKNPSFSGQGYSNHVLALEQLQFTRDAEITKKKEREERDAKRDEENEVINKFIKNVESRIYANLSKQWVVKRKYY